MGKKATLRYLQAFYVYMLYILCMQLSAADRSFLSTVAALSYCNPFTAERLQLERAALGSEYVEQEQSWNVYVGSSGELLNVSRIMARLEPLLGKLQEVRHEEEHAELFDDLVVFYLYHCYRTRLSRTVEECQNESHRPRLGELFQAFSLDVRRFYGTRKEFSSRHYQPEHLFALAFQISRAFFHIYHFVIGASGPMITLRARIWESIFSADLRRYRRALFERMNEFPTLITGPSGTGKELVARAIGLSQFIPFDPRTGRFADDFHLNFHPLNLSAFSPTLIESELFGHKRGSFTGAVADRDGWLHRAGRRGTVFLDEIGELAPEIQVKLLRVIESRTFQRLGDNKTFRFEGKLITATNRLLDSEISAGRFRSDLFFRLIGDRIETPSLRSRLLSFPSELRLLVEFLTRRLLSDGDWALFVQIALPWLEKNIDPNYGWPGNVRELEQCLRNLIIHGAYVPPQAPNESVGTLSSVYQRMEEGVLSVEELLNSYVTHVYGLVRNFEETGRRLGLDRRTVKARVLRSAPSSTNEGD